MLKAQKIFSLMLVTMVLSMAELKAQLLVWPGDASNNGQVTNVDVLYLGYAYGTSGPVRDSVNTNWEAQNIDTPWNQDFPQSPIGMLNYAYADCNGDGNIDSLDFQTIQQNYDFVNVGVTADVFEQGGVGDPELSFMGIDSVVAGGNTMLTLQLELTGPMPVDFYGIAFTVEYDTLTVVPQSVMFQVEEQWINPSQPGTQLLVLDQDNGAGEFDIAISRTDQMSVSGMGTIGTMSLIIEDNLFDIIMPGTDAYLEIKNIRLINDGFETIPVLGDFLTIDLLASDDEIPQSEILKIFPNPANDYIDISTEYYPIKNIECYNSLGQLIFAQTVSSYYERIRLPGYAKGSVILKVKTDKEIYIKKIIKK